MTTVSPKSNEAGSDRIVVTEGRRDYSAVRDVHELPNLIQLQLDSYRWFLERGLKQLFDEVSPIQDFTGKRMELIFGGYALGDPPYNEHECRQRDLTYSAPLRVTVQLVVKDSGEIKEQELFFGDFPLMTATGTFVINGAERVVVSQLVRSPGVYFSTTVDANTGRDLCGAKLIPNRGAWLEFESSARDVLSVKVDRKRKIPVTTLLRAVDQAPEIEDAAELGTDDRIRALLSSVDTNERHQFVQATMAREPALADGEERNKVWALLEVYRRLRPGDPPTAENAQSLLASLFFNPRRYDLGRVGRHKLNKRLQDLLEDSTEESTLRQADLVAIVQQQIRINNGHGKGDDIDHLGNRRIRAVGELIQNQFRVGLLRMERVIRERMTITDPDQATPSALINIRPVVAAMKEFFGGSQLSQFMDQTNPLAELTHKRRLSALGPGGLSRDRAGFDVRDVHHSHYGRICPIETPEGPNIGLIGSLATYGVLNEYGFIQTPYRRVVRELPADSPELIGRLLGENLEGPRGGVIGAAGDPITPAIQTRIGAAGLETVPVQPFVLDEVVYLTADEEDQYVIAQANTPLDEQGNFLQGRVEVRMGERFEEVLPDGVDFIDISPRQIVSVATSLIPFLEHDDANRALMGSNMQRQAVPVLRPEVPLVGTGMERPAAHDSGQVIFARDAGEVLSATGNAITVRYEDGAEETFRLLKFMRSNQGTCINQRPIVAKGEKVRAGQALADSSSTDQGELALGQSILVAFMAWEGYNFEDAVVVSESLVRDDKFTSIQMSKHETEARETKLGPEEITRDIPNVGDESLHDLDENGSIRIGAEVGPGDILVGKITPKGETELTAEEKLLRAIFGEKAREVKDTSLRVPHGVRGTVVDVRVFRRESHDELPAGVEQMVRVTIAERRKLTQGDKMAGRHGNKGVISRILAAEDMPYLEDGTAVDIILNPIGVPSRMNLGQILETQLGWAAHTLGFRAISPVFSGATEEAIQDALARAWMVRAAGATNSNAGPPMPALAPGIDQERVDAWLRSRDYDPEPVFNESLQGVAAQVALVLWLESVGEKRVRALSMEKLLSRVEKAFQEGLGSPPIFGKQWLYDGRNGDRFDQPITVGYIYMMKLSHMVEDKIHARSTGPYSLITQQPLGGKAQFGGQRFGEMEVWALEAYGAAHILQELLTVKSDDVVGRVKAYEAIVKGETVLEPGVPESFKVLVKELQSLGLSVEVLNRAEERVAIEETSAKEVPELGVNLSGFERGTETVLEVNDFDAIRISLASPEQIRSWSYGEVLKPETINYRTLKPEKDGLFCEKIFGPQKDFECMCGKYKRVRYKGIICDKCSVEVTRSKVRRERMAHIELAAPVSHIWFVKGTPSRAALLLDISPRALERVLYFSQYVITGVNAEQKQKAVEHLKLDAEDAVEEVEREITQTLEQLAQVRDARLQAIREVLEAGKTANEAEARQRLEALNAKAGELEAGLTESDGRKARRNFNLDGEMIVVRGEAVNAAKLLKKLQSALAKKIKALEKETAAEEAKIVAQAESDEGQTVADVSSQEEQLRERLEGIRGRAQKELDERIADLEGLVDPIEAMDLSGAVITEQRGAELQERYPGVVQIAMGGEAVLSLLQRVELDGLSERLQVEVASTSGQRRKKAMKRLRVVEALRKSGNKPAWMVFRVLPVLPPDLRPMVQLDGGRFATSDLNDLYRRVINRNNRLKRLLELGAPEIINRNEKRMLQEAVDSLIDNGRRGRAVTGSGNHKLKSLSDMLKGKQGRFRQNLLGKRVDYAGRSVIVVGPELKLHECGLPKRMALELFKPFIMHELVARALAHNIKGAKRVVERALPEVWDVLEDVVKQRPVLLNRAPTLHRLGIQAFEPVLVDGSAIQIHPLVCAAFNADFDGDQMAVHVPLSREAVAEARQIMLSTKNLLLPSSGEPVIAPTLDMVIGCYYLTMMRNGAKRPSATRPWPQNVYGSFEEARLAHDLEAVALQVPITVRDPRIGPERIETTVGRIIFDSVVPAELPFQNQLMDKKALKDLVSEAYTRLGAKATAQMADQIKDLGFKFSTRSGVTIAVDELRIPEEKRELLEKAEAAVSEIRDQFQMGLMTESERYDQTVKVWTEATEAVTEAISQRLDEYGSINLMVSSGAKGNISQLRQMAGMRGLMSDPTGRIIELPIRSSFREGLSVLEYFISTHGARKGLADTALRTADSGYLTRRLIDVAQDVIIRAEDCAQDEASPAGLLFEDEPKELGLLEPLRERVTGRFLAAPVTHPKTGEVLAELDTMLDEETVDTLLAQGVTRFRVRSPMVCGTTNGLCQKCYGRSLATGRVVGMGEAVGIIAAQSIGEPGTQLTMRTFHTGGVAGGIDITSGLPRVEELFEARAPKGQAVIAEIDGQVSILREGELRKVRITATETFRDEYELPSGARIAVKNGQLMEEGALLAHLRPADGESDTKAGAAKKAGKKAATAKKLTKKAEKAGQMLARVGGRVERKPRARTLSVLYEHQDVREYAIPAAARLRVVDAQQVQAGEQVTEGSVNPQDLLRILGVDAVHRYMNNEVQQVYRAQGVNINDKHIEVIVRQMLRKVLIETPGDSDLLAGEFLDRFQYEQLNRRLLEEGRQPASAQPVLLGVTKASLSQSSWLAAASFQETTRILTEAAVTGSVDPLVGLKENVIIGKLIPARAKVELPPLPEPELIPAEEGRPEQLVSEETMEGITDELLRELGFGPLEEPAAEPVAAAVEAERELEELAAGYVAEPGQE